MMRRVGATRIKQFQQCPELWRRTTQQDTDQPSPAQEFGRKVHNAIDQWHKTGVLTGEAEVIAVCQRNERLIKVSPSVTESEREWALKDTPLTGTFDAIVLGEGDPLLIDYKTCKAITNSYTTLFGATDVVSYVMTEDQLAQDVQANLYAWVLMKMVNKSACTARWVYLPRHGIGETVQVTFTRRQCAARCRQLLRIGQRVHELRLDLALDKHESACEMFGGCQFSKTCVRPDAWHNRAALALLKEVETMSDEAKAEWDALLAEDANTTITPAPVEQKTMVSPSKIPTIPEDRVNPKPVPTVPPQVVTVSSGTPRILLVGCAPLGLSVQRVDEYLQPAVRMLQDQGIKDYRLMEYGKGPATILQLARAQAQKAPWEGILVTDIRLPLGRDTYEALAEVADVEIWPRG